jgi:hypothetical protein
MDALTLLTHVKSTFAPARLAPNAVSATGVSRNAWNACSSRVVTGE